MRWRVPAAAEVEAGEKKYRVLAVAFGAFDAFGLLGAVAGDRQDHEIARANTRAEVIDGFQN